MELDSPDRHRYVTQTEPELLDGPLFAVLPQSYEQVGHWGWLICGRLFVSSFRVTSSDIAAGKLEAIKREARQRLLEYVDGELPVRPEDLGLRPPEPPPGLGCIADGDTLPEPPK